jgi:hypothetical protein
MGAHASALFSLDRLRDGASPGGEGTKCARRPKPADESLRFYKGTVRLCNYSGLDLVARDATAVFLDWDDTLFPTTWVQMKQRSCREAGKPFLARDFPTIKTLCGDIIAFLSGVSRIGHVFIVTASAHGFIAKCCRICFPQLMRVLDDLNVTVIYARPQRDVAIKETVEMWKEVAYGAVLQGRSIRPLAPELARFYGAPGYSHILSYGDAWTDHSSLRSAAAAFSPESVLKAVKASGGALSAEGTSRELKMVGRLLRCVACVEVDFPFDMDNAQDREVVEGLASSVPSPTTLDSLDGFSQEIVAAYRKSNLSSGSIASASTAPPSFPETTSAAA